MWQLDLSVFELAYAMSHRVNLLQLLQLGMECLGRATNARALLSQLRAQLRD